MLSELLDEIEKRLRRIVREEINAALSESKESFVKIPYSTKPKAENIEKIKAFPQLLTADEVAELLTVKPARVYELARASKANGFPVIRIGKRNMKFNKQSVIDWLEARTNI
jgi:excisionase family DNA binding protein